MMARVVSRWVGALRPPIAALMCVIALSAATWSALGAQQLIMTANAGRVAVGGQVTVRVEARMGQRARLVERMPTPVGPLPDGVRIVSQDSLTLAAAGTYVGQTRVAFFRPGMASVPALALQFRMADGALPDTLRSRPLPIEVVASLPPGNQPMRDIKDLEALSPSSRNERWLVALAAFALLVLLALAGVRRARRSALRRASGDERRRRARAIASGPYDRALAALSEIESAKWPALGEVPRHYERVTEVLRRYLENAHGIRATDRTTCELVRSLSPALSDGGQREECRALLEEADLVKFARLRPDEATAAEFLARVRALLDRWHASSARAPTAASSSAELP